MQWVTNTFYSLHYLALMPLLREGLTTTTKKQSKVLNFPHYVRGGGGRGRGGQRTNFLGNFIAAQKPFVSLKKASKQTLCSLLTSDKLDIARKSMLKTGCIISIINRPGVAGAVL